jgi:hypothetical protein
MKRSMNFRGRAGSHLTQANLADLMKRYVQPTCKHVWAKQSEGETVLVCEKCGFKQEAAQAAKG